MSPAALTSAFIGVHSSEKSGTDVICVIMSRSAVVPVTIGMPGGYAEASGAKYVMNLLGSLAVVENSRSSASRASRSWATLTVEPQPTATTARNTQPNERRITTSGTLVKSGYG